MKLKARVDISRLHPDLQVALTSKIEPLFNAHDSFLVITAGCEGSPEDKIHLPNSKHYTQANPSGFGEAIDCRTKHLSMGTITSLVADLKVSLGDDFNVVHDLSEMEHLHVQLSVRR